MQTFPDLQTVFFVCCPVNLVVCLGLLLVYRTRRAYPGFLHWSLASAAVFLSVALLALRGYLPPGPTLVVVNLLFFAYPLLVARGLRAFFGRRPQNWIAPVVLVVVLAVAIYFTNVSPNLNRRIILLSLIEVPLFADCAWLVQGEKIFARPAVRRWLIASFSLLVVWNLLRVPLTTFFESNRGDLMSPSLIQAGTLVLGTVVNLAVAIGVIVLNFERTSDHLRESEERFRNLSGAAFEGIAISENGRIIDANDRALQMLGYSRPELIGREIVSLVTPETRALVASSVGAGREALYEHELMRKDGTRFRAEAQARMVRLDGRTVRITALRDITERLNLQADLQASEERFRSAMHHSPIGMALVALDGRWLEVNPALCDIVGYPREEMLNRDFQSLTHPDDLPVDREAVKRLVAGQSASYHREKRYLHKDGRVIWAQIHVSLITNADGTPRHLVSQTLDVTERKRTEKALQDYQAQLVLAMDTAKLGHWEFDPATGFFTFDENFYKLLGTTVAQEGSTQMSAETYARKFIPPAEAATVAEEVRLALATTDPHYTRRLEHGFRRADGSPGVMAVRFAIQKDASGRTIKTYGLNQDITDQAQSAEHHRHLEEQLRHAQKMDALGTLAGGIAHDFNNIITGIMGNLQLAEMDLPTGHPALARLREAGRASRRARDQVARILTFSRRYQGDKATVPLGPVITETAQLLHASLPASIEIRTAVAEGCPPVLCDATQIHQVIMNLGTNAAYAMRDRGGVLEISLKFSPPDRTLLERHPQVKESHRICLTVRDTGCGMDAPVLQHIFEPFFTTKAVGEGTGLGLAMVHGIMEEHQGAIVVESAPGHGTLFDLYFPAAADPRSNPVSPGSGTPFVASGLIGRGRKIMVVDDDTAVLRVATQILQRFGFVVEAFASPAAAKDSFQAAPADFAAVVSDLTMPGMTGVELARDLRQIRPDLPFILTSGYLHTGVPESSVTHIVRKPFDIQEFVSQLDSALSAAAPKEG